MEDITQIKVSNVTYDICDATAETSLSEISDWFICDGKPSYSEHSCLYTEKDTGSPCFATKHPNNEKSYIFNLWGDTSNIRLDSYDHTSGTRTILGYVPLSDHQTNKEVEIVSGTSLITPETGWTVNNCQIARWGQIIQIYASMKKNATISVTSTGNITNIFLGTLNSVYWPKDFPAYAWFGDDTHAWGYVGTDGRISIGAFDGTGSSRSIAANTNIYLYSRYILSMDTNQF